MNENFRITICFCFLFSFSTSTAGLSYTHEVMNFWQSDSFQPVTSFSTFLIYAPLINSSYLSLKGDAPCSNCYKGGKTGEGNPVPTSPNADSQKQQNEGDGGTSPVNKGSGAENQHSSASGGGKEPPDGTGEALRLKKILMGIDEILLKKNRKLILSLDIDKTISYGDSEDKLHKPYFDILESFMNERRYRWIWIYNTSRIPRTMLISNWGEKFPPPDVLIMGGGEFSYSSRLKQMYSDLQDERIQWRWLYLWPSVFHLGLREALAAEYSHVLYQPQEPLVGLALGMLMVRTEYFRLKLWHRYPSVSLPGQIFCYDRFYNKGAGLKRVIHQLERTNMLSDGRYWLVSSGDSLPDSSMMTGKMVFPFDSEETMGIPDLPLNVNFLGSVLPHEARLTNAELKHELLSDTFTVDALEPNVIGIMDAVLTLLEVLQDTLD